MDSAVVGRIRKYQELCMVRCTKRNVIYIYSSSAARGGVRSFKGNLYIKHKKHVLKGPIGIVCDLLKIFRSISTVS